MPKANSMAWVVITGVIPILLMTGMYSRVVYSLWYQNVDNDENNTQQVRCVSSVCVSSVKWVLQYTSYLSLFFVTNFLQVSILTVYILIALSCYLLLTRKE